ncbi:aspartic peptidase domain-containing protein [Mycena olivaceomarginata]|nr:aspartic peptidase domain-containing protein [Mycena olivaceomarginata]
MGIPVDDGFTASDVSGIIGFASVTMGGYTVNQQVFNNATSVTLAGILDAGLDGLIGLSFDGRGPSPLTDTLQQNGMNPALGEPFLFNVFGQTPDQNHFIGISLSRTDDLEGSADASFTINEVDSRYEAVLDAPVLPLFPGNNGVWSVLVDGMTVDGQTVPLPPSQAGAPPGKLVTSATRIDGFDGAGVADQFPSKAKQVTTGLPLGTPGAELLPPFVDAIYSRIPGAELVEISDGSQLWTLPCNTTTIVSLQFGSVFTHLGALLLIVITAVNRFLSTRWTSPNPEEDLLYGDSFMRNFYSVLDRIQNHISQELREELKRTELKAERTKAYSRERLSWFYSVVPEGQVRILTELPTSVEGSDFDIVMAPAIHNIAYMHTSAVAAARLRPDTVSAPISPLLEVCTPVS